MRVLHRILCAIYGHEYGPWSNGVHLRWHTCTRCEHQEFASRPAETRVRAWTP